MSRKLVCALAAMAVSLSVVSTTDAAPVTWTVDSSKSQIALSFPDQSVTVEDVSVTIRVRNQSGAGSVWNSGNSASLAGTLATNYTEGGTHSIEFLSAPVAQITAINSGSYRPNPSAFNSGTGQYTNTSTAPAVYGFLVRTGAFPEPIDLAFVSLNTVSYQLTTPAIAVSGTTGGTFSANLGMLFGIQAAQAGVDGLMTQITGQPLDDTLFAAASMVNANSAASATIVDGGGGLRTLTIPISTPFQFEVQGGVLLSGTMTGTIVATAMVPEPAAWISWAAGGFALVGVRAGRQRRGAPQTRKRPRA